MQIETLKERIANATERKEKLEKKIKRIEIALNGGANPYYYNQDDMRYAKRDLEETEHQLNKYQALLTIEINKENAPKIEVLVEFLKQWKEKANIFYHEQAIKLYEEYEKHIKKCEEIRKIEDRQERNNKDNEEYARHREVEKEFNSINKNLRKYKEPYIDEVGLEKALNREVKAKYEDLVYRIKNVVGELEDCELLKIGDNGSINGIVKGKEGKARVETIYAGGYNIQCLHYRVIIHKMK